MYIYIYILRGAMGEWSHEYNTMCNQFQSPSLLPKGAVNCPDAASYHLTWSSPSEWDCDLPLSSNMWSHLQKKCHTLGLVPQGYWQNKFPQHLWIKTFKFQHFCILINIKYMKMKVLWKLNQYKKVIKRILLLSQIFYLNSPT